MYPKRPDQSTEIAFTSAQVVSASANLARDPGSCADPLSLTPNPISRRTRGIRSRLAKKHHIARLEQIIRRDVCTVRGVNADRSRKCAGQLVLSVFDAGVPVFG